MNPLVVSAGISAVGAIAQYYQAEKARGAAEGRLKQIERQWNALVPPEYDVSIMDPPEYIMESVPPSAFDLDKLSPQQYQVIGQYKPEVAQYIEEQRPELVRMSQTGKEGRQSQIDALRRMRGIAESDFDPALAAELSKASRQAQIDAQSRAASIDTDMQRRGAANSGLAMMAKLSAGADAMDREAMLGQNAAAEAYRNRLSAIRDSANMGRGLASDDVSLQEKNASIINDFNQRLTKGRRDWANSRADVLNDAQLKNLAVAQGVADRNVTTGNEYDVRERNRLDSVAEKMRDQKVKERDYINSVREGQAKWKQGERDNQNKIKSQQFGDKIDIIKGKSGVAGDRANLDIQKGRDTNALIQGIVNAGVGYYGSQPQQQQSGLNQVDDGLKKKVDNHLAGIAARAPKKENIFEDDDSIIYDYDAKRPKFSNYA